MSNHESPEIQALKQLEHLVGHLGEELAVFRKRALQAEAKLRTYESSTSTGDLFAEQRAARLEKENAELRSRLATAAERTKGVLEQVRFLRQQASRPVNNSGGER